MPFLTTTTIATVGFVALAPISAMSGGENEPVFDAPVQLTAGGESFKDVIYPTPVLFDVDRDDQRELVIGDLRGNIFVCKNEGDADNGAWTTKQSLTVDGKPIRLNNW